MEPSNLPPRPAALSASALWQTLPIGLKRRGPGLDDPDHADVVRGPHRFHRKVHGGHDDRGRIGLDRERVQRRPDLGLPRDEDGDLHGLTRSARGAAELKKDT